MIDIIIAHIMEWLRPPISLAHTLIGGLGGMVVIFAAICYIANIIISFIGYILYKLKKKEEPPSNPFVINLCKGFLNSDISSKKYRKQTLRQFLKNQYIPNEDKDKHIIKTANGYVLIAFVFGYGLSILINEFILK